ncbi:MAG: DUF488 domain-containing protein [Chloracidobacterium sp.]|nr:DUF488 domain-containing protein [Chloracidobacterium sp.]
MENVLYDLGYNDFKKAEELLQVTKALNAVIADIRFMPHTRNPEFSQKHLQEVLGARYAHIQALGNKNYRGEGATEFADVEKGVAELHGLMEKGNVIVMCACWKRSDCHRLDAAEEYQKRFGITVTPITKAGARKLIEKSNPQMTLFSGE